LYLHNVSCLQLSVLSSTPMSIQCHPIYAHPHLSAKRLQRVLMLSWILRDPTARKTRLVRPVRCGFHLPRPHEPPLTVLLVHLDLCIPVLSHKVLVVPVTELTECTIYQGRTLSRLTVRSLIRPLIYHYMNQCKVSRNTSRHIASRYLVHSVNEHNR
jgi:hypothetical protein